MPSYNLKNVEIQYHGLHVKFMKWAGSLNTEAKNELWHDADELKKQLNKFGELLQSWHRGDTHNQVDIDTFTNHLNNQLTLIVKKHQDLAEKAKAFTPSVMKSVKSYLSAIIESLQKLCKAVADFVSAASKKAKNTISTSFSAFKQSMQNIGKKENTAKGNPANKNSGPTVV